MVAQPRICLHNWTYGGRSAIAAGGCANRTVDQRHKATDWYHAAVLNMARGIGTLGAQSASARGSGLRTRVLQAFSWGKGATGN